MANIVSSTKSSLESAVPRPNFKPPAIPKGVAPTKINITTGKGVPGGFDVASIKSPLAEVLKLGGAISAISSKAAGLTSALSAIKSGGISSIPGIPNASKTLDGLKGKAMDKLNAAAKAPDFKKRIKLPTPPRLPPVPDFASAGIPNVPTVPSVNVPKLPSLPSTPTLPKLPSLSG